MVIHKLILSMLAVAIASVSLAQKPSLELTFTAIDSATHIQLDSIKVMNRTQGGDTVLYYPDTVLVLDYIVGIDEGHSNANGLRVSQNYPNPVAENTTISIYVPEKGLVRCLISDNMGRVIVQYEEFLESGVHTFTYSPGGGEMSFFTVLWQNSRETIKMLHPNLNQSGFTSLSYLGLSSTPEYEYKAFEAMQGFSFALEDELLYIGYIEGMESGILDAPMVGDTFYFQFATNIPCPGTPTVTYEGQVYNTIQIYSQCWMKENLNVGEIIPGDQNMSNNGHIEKYCYDEETDSCDKYGGLYQWDEMMQYTTIQGTQGICPEGWHIPSDMELNVMDGSVDSQYGIGDSIWYKTVSRGFDVGLRLKTATGWYNNYNGNNMVGFSFLPSGWHYPVEGVSYNVGKSGSIFSSSEDFEPSAWFGGCVWYNNTAHRGPTYKVSALSVRCIKD